jgi:hypothetical protein
MSNKPQTMRVGIFDMQVCVPEEYTDEEVKNFADFDCPCGTEHGWQIRREGDLNLSGDPERRKCAEREGYVHIMLDA